MKIITIIGARPQFIKAAVVSLEISRHFDIQEIIVHTGQHYDNNMSDVFFDQLNIPKPLFNLGIGGGLHGENTGRMIESIEKILLENCPNIVLLYGDTDSTLAGAIASAKLNIPVAHIEAGLRSYNKKMPEEINRLITDHISKYLFVPTNNAKDNLFSEGIIGDNVINVGDVMYDAILQFKKNSKYPLSLIDKKMSTFLLCTIHRSENTSSFIRMNNIVKMLNDLSNYYQVVLPLHPRTKKALIQLNCDCLSPNIIIIDPVGYFEMNWLLENCLGVITDSGGLQKEAYFHSKKCVTIREETEWIELVDNKYNLLVSPTIVINITIILSFICSKIEIKKGIYGDGNAASKIINHLKDSYKSKTLS